MSKNKAQTATDMDETASTAPGGVEGEKGAHTELRPAGVLPRARAKVLPPELDDEPGEDDPFNDMPV
jgi:hypothetical protein